MTKINGQCEGVTRPVMRNNLKSKESKDLYQELEAKTKFVDLGAHLKIMELMRCGSKKDMTQALEILKSLKDDNRRLYVKKDQLVVELDPRVPFSLLTSSQKEEKIKSNIEGGKYLELIMNAGKWVIPFHNPDYVQKPLTR